MTSSRLSHAIDTWTCQAVGASRFLQGLYRLLGDGKQAANAIQAGWPAEERGRRVGLCGRIAAFRLFPDQGASDEVRKEARAWALLVESQEGICAFHALLEGHPEKTRGLRGGRSTAAKAFDRALAGYRMAFPEELAEEGIRRAIECAATTCAETFVDDLASTEPLEEREALCQGVYRDILASLSQAIWPISAEGGFPENDAMEVGPRPVANTT